MLTPCTTSTLTHCFMSNSITEPLTLTYDVTPQADTTHFIPRHLPNKVISLTILGGDCDAFQSIWTDLTFDHVTIDLVTSSTVVSFTFHT